MWAALAEEIPAGVVRGGYVADGIERSNGEPR